MVEGIIKKRRKIGVLRGMLRHMSFQFLREKPMSGSEIVDKIEEYTDWRPSPGSIYPLLSQMQETGMIQPHKDNDPSLKRFKLTEKGKQHANEHSVIDKHIRGRNMMIRKMYWKLHQGMSDELYDSLKDLLDTLEEVNARHKDNTTVTERVKSVLDSAVENIKEIEA